MGFSINDNTGIITMSLLIILSTLLKLTPGTHSLSRLLCKWSLLHWFLHVMASKWCFRSGQRAWLPAMLRSFLIGWWPGIIWRMIVQRSMYMFSRRRQGRMSFKRIAWFWGTLSVWFLIYLHRNWRRELVKCDLTSDTTIFWRNTREGSIRASPSRGYRPYISYGLYIIRLLTDCLRWSQFHCYVSLASDGTQCTFSTILTHAPLSSTHRNQSIPFFLWYGDTSTVAGARTNWAWSIWRLVRFRHTLLYTNSIVMLGTSILSLHRTPRHGSCPPTAYGCRWRLVIWDRRSRPEQKT